MGSRKGRSGADDTVNMHDLRASNPSSAEGSGAADTPLANGADGGADGDNALMGIQDVARKLGVTLRTLRFYEKEGLIKPERVGTAARVRRPATVHDVGLGAGALLGC